MKTLYLSGGITGVPNYLNKFKVGEEYLKDCGYKVINPTLIHPFIDCSCKFEDYEIQHTWQCNMRHDLIAMLQNCDGIALLPNWYASRGAQVELTLAKGLGFEWGTVNQWADWARNESRSY